MAKQSQNVGNGSKAVQVDGDLNVGCTYTEVRQIFEDLFELNFPKLQVLAKAEAERRVGEFLKEVRSAMESKSADIDPDRFQDPGLQYEMQSMVVDAARRGDKSNPDVLAELLCLISTRDCPDLIELIATEVRKIIPGLSRKHLNCLSLYVLYIESSMGENADLSQIDTALNGVLARFADLDSVANSDLSYLSSNGCLQQMGVRHMGIVPSIVKTTTSHKDIKLDALEDLATRSGYSSIVKVIELSKTLHIGTFSLSAYGRLIGWLNLKDFSNVDLRSLF